MRITADLGCRWLLGGCEDELLPGFRALGFTVLQTRDVEPLPGWRFRSHLLAVALDDLAAGRVSGRFAATLASALSENGQHLVNRSA